MIEATCSACGALNRVSEANVPVGAKFIACVDCKSRIALAPPSAPAVPPLPRAPSPPVPRAGTPLDLSDLPAPKRASTLGSPPLPATPRAPSPRPPPPRPAIPAALDPDLPSPRSGRPAGPTPSPRFDLGDPASAGLVNGPDAGEPGGIDLPAPKRASLRPAAPDAPRADIVDLPAPKLDRGEADLPAPKLPARRGIADLPAPRDPARRGARESAREPGASGPGLFDPPASGPATGPRLADLPPPRPPEAARAHLVDLPAPKGFFDDLPQPAAHQPDLPAPKGFFDDLPQVKSNPSTTPEVPAPKGFFDGIPALPHTSKPEPPAPKGFFDDIPALPHTSKPEPPAPKGFFDDIPALPHGGAPAPPAKAFFDELTLRGRPAKPARRDTPAAREPDVEIETGPELDLIAPTAEASSSFDDLATATAPAPPSRAARFDPPSHATTLQPAMIDSQVTDPGALLELDETTINANARLTIHAPARTQPASAPAPSPPARARRSRIVLSGLLVAAALGSGGLLLYRRHVAAVERDATIAAELAEARKAYASSDPQHWQHAATSARQVLELDETNAEALGIGAEALLASALSDGTRAAPKISQAHAMLDVASSGGIATPALARARALALLAAHQPEPALAQLQPLADKAPQDATLALYLGWALAGKGDPAAARRAFDRAASAPAVKLDALYGRGQARLALDDFEGARSDFNAVLELDRNHVGAQVGLAAAQPPAAALRREADLLAILARKDIAAADPRAVIQAWTLAGDAAMRAGRFDVARERLKKARALDELDLAAMAGLAETELRDGKVPQAAELTARALGLAKDNVAAQLVQSEIEIRQRRLPLANQRLTALASRATPLTALEQARLSLVTGKLREAEGKDDEAAAAYIAGAEAAHELDLDPMVAAVGKLTALTAAAVADHNQARASDLRDKTDRLLGNFAEQAASDPQLALTLGVGYLQAGNAERAELWLRHVVETRPKDPEARFQLGRALLKAERPDEALEALAAALGLDPTRADIGAELARSYEALGRDGEAGALYDRLLAARDPSLELRARSGRFFARTGAIAKATAQGAKILEADPRHPAGLYLRGEGLLLAGKSLEAKQQFQRAIDGDRDPQYLDALGRAAEALASSGDREAQELALRSYAQAAEAAPQLLNPLVGQGRLYLARHEAGKAVEPLTRAQKLAPATADILFLLGAAYQDSQQPALARKALEDSVKLAPSAEAYWRIAQIERDANRGAQAVDALLRATRLAAEGEKRTGQAVTWLTEALYLLGRISLDLHNETGAREAWASYLARKPAPSAQLTEVKQLLATTLRP